MITEWCYEDICKEIGAPNQSLPGENSMHPIDTAITEHWPSLPALDFMSVGLLCHVIDTDLPWLVQFSLPRHSQTSVSWRFTHLLKTAALSLWAPYFISHLDLVLLDCYTNLLWDIYWVFSFSIIILIFDTHLRAEFSLRLCTTHHLWLPMSFLCADIWNWFCIALLLINSQFSSKSQLKIYLLALACIG